MLRRRESARYERQIMMSGWGVEGQEKLKKAKVIVVGAGGLGSAILTYLAAAGVGNIRIVDSDKVELTNLNRQTLYSTEDIGKMKATVARERLSSLNPNIHVEAISERISERNVSGLVADYPIMDALDNLSTRYLLNRVAISQRLPLFHGAVYGFEGRATTIVPGRTPCLKCLYQGVMPGKTPVVGVTPAIIGCIQATEMIKYVLGCGELLAGRLLLYDGLSMRFTEVKVGKDPSCEDCRGSTR